MPPMRAILMGSVVGLGMLVLLLAVVRRFCCEGHGRGRDESGRPTRHGRQRVRTTEVERLSEERDE